MFCQVYITVLIYTNTVIQNYNERHVVDEQIQEVQVNTSNF